MSVCRLLTTAGWNPQEQREDSGQYSSKGCGVFDPMGWCVLGVVFGGVGGHEVVFLVLFLCTILVWRVKPVVVDLTLLTPTATNRVTCKCL